MSNEIKKSDVVVNMTIYESDGTSEEEDFELPEMTRKTRIGSIDETTEETCDILTEILEDVCKVEPLGRQLIYLEFYNPKGITFVNKNQECDFDLNEDGYPLLPDGAEEFIVPFFKRVKELHPELNGMTIETNSNKFKFKV